MSSSTSGYHEGGVVHKDRKVNSDWMKFGDGSWELTRIPNEAAVAEDPQLRLRLAAETLPRRCVQQARPTPLHSSASLFSSLRSGTTDDPRASIYPLSAEGGGGRRGGIASGEECGGKYASLFLPPPPLAHSIDSPFSPLPIHSPSNDDLLFG